MDGIHVILALNIRDRETNGIDLTKQLHSGQYLFLEEDHIHDRQVRSTILKRKKNIRLKR